MAPEGTLAGGTPLRSNVIPFVARASAVRAASTLTVSKTAAAIIADAFWEKLGTTDLVDHRVQLALNGVLDELTRYWREEAERHVCAHLLAENEALREKMTRRDAAPST
jgi:hypothetical protein